MGVMYENICSWENLLIAHRKAAKGKRGRRAAAAFEYNLADNLLALQQDLVSHTYRPGEYRIGPAPGCNSLGRITSQSLV